jgi:4-hydroxybenzoate polyprenyltransferase
VAALDLFRLLRWPGAVTAAANAATGFLVVAPADVANGATAAACAALGGAVVYAGGVVLNDVADAERDRETHPGRPIPSGRVGRDAAARFGLVLLVGGSFVSMLGAGPWAGAATAAAAVFALLYDFGAKRFRFPGAAALGLARAANALAGVLAAAATPDVLDAATNAPAVVYPLAVLAYTAALTFTSTLEESRPGRGALGACAGALFVAAALPTSALATGWRTAPAVALLPQLGVLVAAARVAAEPGGPGAGVLVRAGVFGFLLADAAWLFAVGRYGAGFGLVLGYVALRLVLARARS